MLELCVRLGRGWRPEILRGDLPYFASIMQHEDMSSWKFGREILGAHGARSKNHSSTNITCPDYLVDKRHVSLKA